MPVEHVQMVMEMMMMMMRAASWISTTSSGPVALDDSNSMVHGSSKAGTCITSAGIDYDYRDYVSVAHVCHSERRMWLRVARITSESPWPLFVCFEATSSFRLGTAAHMGSLSVSRDSGWRMQRYQLPALIPEQPCVTSPILL